MVRWIRRLVWLLVLGSVIGGVAWAAPKVRQYVEERNKPEFETIALDTGDVVFTIRATGTVQPVVKVTIGAAVSGPLLPDVPLPEFNQRVKKDELLAQIDPSLYQAAVDRDKASVATAEAEVRRTRALLTQAMRDEARSLKLSTTNPDYISGSELDQYRFNRESLEAQLLIAEASVIQAKANLLNSETNLRYTKILAPVDGIVIDRKIEPGQTLASGFQAPELFVIAPEMEERMWLFANVMEADVGHVRQAYEDGSEVRFFVDAYPDVLHQGRVIQIRQNPLPEQTVVTYPVIVETPNPELRLMPGMTAIMDFEVARRENVLRIPDEAVRFVPRDVEQVREEDRDILTGRTEQEEDDAKIEAATDVVQAQQRSKKRHVWRLDKETGLLRALEVTIGIDNRQYYELVEGDLAVGDELVVGLKIKGAES